VTDTGYSMMHGTPVEKAWEWAKAGLTEVAKTCNEFGLVIALEAGPGTIVRDSRDTIRIIKEMGLENIRALLDVGHAMVTFCDFWRENGPHPVDAIHDLKGYLVHLHVHDNQGLLDQHLVPGTGVIDFEAIVDALREVGYSGYMALEPNVRDPIKGFKEGKTYLEKFLMR
jgi:sugar phosphate isomerase/epimerase